MKDSESNERRQQMLDVLSVLEAFQDLKDLAGALEDAPPEKKQRILMAERSLKIEAKRQRERQIQRDGIGF